MIQKKTRIGILGSHTSSCRPGISPSTRGAPALKTLAPNKHLAPCNAPILPSKVKTMKYSAAQATGGEVLDAQKLAELETLRLRRIEEEKHTRRLQLDAFCRQRLLKHSQILKSKKDVDPPTTAFNQEEPLAFNEIVESEMFRPSDPKEGQMDIPTEPYDYLFRENMAVENPPLSDVDLLKIVTWARPDKAEPGISMPTEQENVPVSHDDISKKKDNAQNLVNRIPSPSLYKRLHGIIPPDYSGHEQQPVVTLASSDAKFQKPKIERRPREISKKGKIMKTPIAEAVAKTKSDALEKKRQFMKQERQHAHQFRLLQQPLKPPPLFDENPRPITRRPRTNYISPAETFSVVKEHDIAHIGRLSGRD